MSENFIYSDPKITTNTNRPNEYYTLHGLETFVDNDNNHRTTEAQDKNVFAKKTYTVDGSPKFYIRVGNNGDLYNPVSIYGEEKTYTFLNRVCKDTIRYKEVNSKVFSLYISFLNTKNIAWLHNAEREAR